MYSPSREDRRALPNGCTSAAGDRARAYHINASTAWPLGRPARILMTLPTGHGVEPPDTQGSSVGPYSIAIRHRCPEPAFRGEADLHHRSLSRAEGRDPAKIHRDGCETARSLPSARQFAERAGQVSTTWSASASRAASGRGS